MENVNALTAEVGEDLLCKKCKKQFKTNLNCLKHKEKCLIKHNNVLSDELKKLIFQLATEYNVNRTLEKDFDKVNMDYKELLEKYKKQELKLVLYKDFLLNNKHILNDISFEIPPELLE